MTGYAQAATRRIPADLIVPDAETDNLEVIDDAMRERLEDETEKFLYELYDAISAVLAARFRGLLEQATHELNVLRDIANSLDIPVAEDSARPPNADIDRIVWRQVARSSTLALFDWLMKHSSGRSVPSATWARRCCDAAFDFETFRRETSLGVDDARLAVEVSAHAIVQSGLLNQPRPLWYRGKYVTPFALAGDMWCMTTKSQPMMWFPMAGKERPIVIQTEDIISVRLPDATEVDLVPLTPWVGVQQNGQQLIIGPIVRQAHGKAEPVTNGVAVKIDDRCRSVMTANGLRIACKAPGSLSFSVPRNALTSYDHGFLLEWNLMKHIR
jgi:hypothetical protein